MGRLMAKLLHRLEITKTDTLVEAQRGDLVATHIGQTAVKTRERIDEAKEGLLFVDEAYRLSGGGEKDFVIRTVVAEFWAFSQIPVMIVRTGQGGD